MYLLEGLKKKIDKTYGNKAKESCIYKCIIRCLQCFMECIARTIEFINKHAYIQIALKGDNFCTAAWEGFGLILRNLGRFSTLILLGSFFTLFGMIFIAAGSAVIGYFVITKVDMFSEDLNSPVLPVVASPGRCGQCHSSPHRPPPLRSSAWAPGSRPRLPPARCSYPGSQPHGHLPLHSGILLYLLFSLLSLSISSVLAHIMRLQSYNYFLRKPHGSRY